MTGYQCRTTVQNLSRRFAGRRTGTVLSGVAATDGEAADAGRKEGEGVVLRLGRVEVIRRAGRGRTVARGLESGLGSSAIERAS